MVSALLDDLKKWPNHAFKLSFFYKRHFIISFIGNYVFRFVSQHLPKFLIRDFNVLIVRNCFFADYSLVIVHDVMEYILIHEPIHILDGIKSKLFSAKMFVSKHLKNHFPLFSRAIMIFLDIYKIVDFWIFLLANI